MGEPGKNINTAYLEIENGDTASLAVKKLVNHNIIETSQKELFLWYIRLFSLENKLAVGVYKINPFTSLGDIIWKLYNREIDFVKITFPEGVTSSDIAKKLEKSGITSQKAFLQVIKNGVPPECNFKFKNLLNNNSLEGFLFPDTYFFPLHSSPQLVVCKMLERFEEVFPASYEKRLQDKGITFYQLIILASMIEQEAQLDRERPIIASVYYNRLRLGMLFECDATLQYILPERKRFLTFKDLEIDSPYNTYKYAGFPPTPICNPGLASIKAAINPSNTSYLYYVISGKEDGTHIFSTNFNDHLNAINRLQEKNIK